MTFRFVYLAALLAMLTAAALEPAAAQPTARAATTTSLSASPAPAYDDEDVTLTASVVAVDTTTDAPLGMVEFLEGATSLGLVPLKETSSGGEGSITLRLGLGPHPLAARYLGDARFDVSISAPLHLAVNGR